MDSKPQDHHPALAAKQIPIKTLILYASETGNCEQISEDLFEDIKSNRENDGLLKDVKRFKLNSLLEKGKQPPKNSQTFELQDKASVKVCLIVASSTGNGDCPENGEKFFRFLRRQTNLLAENQASNQLSHVFYTVLGLGSTDYTKYQHIPRFIDKKLEALGAKKFYYRAEADDATGLEEAVEPWLEGVQAATRNCIQDVRKMEESAFLEMVREEQVEETQQNGQEVKVEPQEQKSTQITYFGKIAQVKQINSGVQEKYSGDPTVKPVYHVVLSFGRSFEEDKIQCGQSFSLFPQNNEEEVNTCIQAFGWNESELVGNKTVKQLLCQDIDIRSQKVNLNKLWPSATEEASPFGEYVENLKTRSRGEIVCLLDIAKDYLQNEELAQHKEAKIPQYMVEEQQIIPRIKPRFYSIVNDPFVGRTKQKAKELEIVISETKYHKNEEQRLGLCTAFLTNPQNLNSVEFKCQFSRSYRILRLPQPPADETKVQNLIIIAHGTGVAPFISMLECIQRANMIQKYAICMLFGTRDNQEDFLFKDFLLNFFASSPHSTLLLACSRHIHPMAAADNVHAHKGYVQAVLKDNPVLGELKLSEHLSTMLLDPTASLQICGNKSTMGKETIDALRHVNVFASDREVETMKANEQILMELWGE